VISATLLRDTDTFATMDVYLNAKMKDATEWTKSKAAKGKNPKWEPNENVTLELDGG